MFLSLSLSLLKVIAIKTEFLLIMPFDKCALKAIILWIIIIKADVNTVSSEKNNIGSIASKDFYIS